MVLLYDRNQLYEKDKVLEILNQIDIDNLNLFFSLLRDMDLDLDMRKRR